MTNVIIKGGAVEASCDREPVLLDELDEQLVDQLVLVGGGLGEHPAGCGPAAFGGVDSRCGPARSNRAATHDITAARAHFLGAL